MTWRCDFCNCNVVPNGNCPSCELYKVAVHCSKVAASEIAKLFNRRCRNAWLNEHGVFACLNGKAIQIASADAARPFMQLITAARQVTFPQGHMWDSGATASSAASPAACPDRDADR